MYLHLGLDRLVTYDEIIGIFDLDTTTVEKNTRESLSNAEKAGMVENVCNDLPKSFVVCESGGVSRIYITQLSSATLAGRAESNEIPEQ